LLKRGRRPYPPGRGGGAAAVRGEGRLEEVERLVTKPAPATGPGKRPGVRDDLVVRRTGWLAHLRLLIASGCSRPALYVGRVSADYGIEKWFSEQSEQ